MTLSACLAFLRKAGRAAIIALGLGSSLVSAIDLVDFGVVFPLDGILLGVSSELLVRARLDLLSFFKRRPVRCSADLAKGFLA